MLKKMTAKTEPVLVLSGKLARVIVDTRVIELPDPTADELSDLVGILDWKTERGFEDYVLDIISDKEDGMKTEKIHNDLLRIYRSPSVLRREALWAIRAQSGMEATGIDHPVKEAIESSVFFFHIMGLIDEVEDGVWMTTRTGRAFYEARFGTESYIVIS